MKGSPKPTVWLSSLNGARHKLIEDHLRGRAMYFDLLHDPGEDADPSEQQPEIATHLRRLLATVDAGLIDMGEAVPAPTISDEGLQRLRSLGYL